MRTSTNKPNSENKNRLEKQLIEEHHLSTELKPFFILDANAIAKGIGRKATIQELIDYLERDKGSEPVSLDKAFSKYVFKQ